MGSINSKTNIIASDENPNEEKRMIINIDEIPFSSGGLRSAHKCRVISKNKNGELLVAKRPKNGNLKKDQYRVDEVTQLFCKEMTSIFLYNLRKTDNSKYKKAKINIITPTMMHIITKRNFYLFNLIKISEIVSVFDEDEVIWVEPWLDGEYEKFNNNFGWVNPEWKNGIPQALSHFSWASSKGRLMLVDLQGVRDENHIYTLTDPAWHSLDKSMGSTDLGPLGMLQFFRTHECSQICSELPRLKINDLKIELIMKGVSEIDATTKVHLGDIISNEDKVSILSLYKEMIPDIIFLDEKREEKI